ncbi:hypothetical protein POJ06DRAFT_39456 [Lipomyces tetrasporus]|uniref:Secreted peptide n=1 Tax=Lipomyces tetrasporus TaxID=54092 RepID=A0AAD7VQE9_9ASCO|nr:uncharacterized protein POJ06DRAFT_39456 [Lipomyces tetrasporus]KAJ8097090.1 hypothetical protein POJ06DRAFT_39456 [Lipomyces tetrasporus]
MWWVTLTSLATFFAHIPALLFCAAIVITGHRPPTDELNEQHHRYGRVPLCTLVLLSTSPNSIYYSTQRACCPSNKLYPHSSPQDKTLRPCVAIVGCLITSPSRQIPTRPIVSRSSRRLLLPFSRSFIRRCFVAIVLSFFLLWHTTSRSFLSLFVRRSFPVTRISRVF